MIIPMYKYSFLVFYKDYHNFLKKLQHVGVLHVVEKDVNVTNEIKQKYNQLKQCDKTIQFLESREVIENKPISKLNGLEIINAIKQKQEELEELEIKLETSTKELLKSKPWGNFSPEIIEKLEKHNIHFRFFTTSKKKFQELEKTTLPIEIISETGNLVYFLFIEQDEKNQEIDANELKAPKFSYSEIVRQKANIEVQISKINSTFDDYAGSAINTLKTYKKELANSLQFDNVVLNTSVEADEKLMILEGWVPKTKKENIDNFLSKSDVLFVTAKATPADKIPVLLKNNRFSKLFEPIGSMFSLPDYSELDLTLFFAPFFMLFFGFCLGDAGYGILFILGAGIYKLKAKPELKPYLSLIQFLGLATIIFGAVSGTFFGINLIEAEIAWLANYKNLFLNPDKMFNLALILGGVQIIFGLFIRAANQIRQFGLNYALATFGWLIILLGSIAYVVLSKTKIIPENKTILYVILSTGGFFILFFSDPKINVFARIGKGVWDIYSTVTGIFGDLLSYIRLFALGLSSAILGFVINDIGLQILASSKILGPVFFVLFMIVGHTLNILISSLGSFVHPMRLTFVEFYKSAGFKGGGIEYKPFRE